MIKYKIYKGGSNMNWDLTDIFKNKEEYESTKQD